MSKIKVEDLEIVSLWEFESLGWVYSVDVDGEVYRYTSPLPRYWRDGRLLGLAETKLPRVGWAGDS